MSNGKKNVLLVGGGAVGSIAAINLECGGLAEVTAVLRSNYSVVRERGYKIESVDHGKLESWRPTTSTLNHIHSSRFTYLFLAVLPAIPQASSTVPFDYIVCTTKNCPDVPPTLIDLLRPAVTPGHTVVVLLQNGLNIELPLFSAFPQNIVLSGVSMIDSHEASPGHIKHEEADLLYLATFSNPNLPGPSQTAAAHDFIKLYSAGGKTNCQFFANV